jgi:hypothetical protein
VAFALVSVSAVARAAPAADGRARLEVLRGAGAEGCPDARAVREAVAARVGHDPFSDGGDRVLRCRIDAGTHGLRAEITARAGDGAVVGARSLSSADRSCRDLVPALLLVLSLAARATDTAADLAASPPAPPPAVPVARAVAPPARAPLAVRAGAAVFATDASLPGPSAGVAASIGVARDRGALSLEVAGEAPRSLALPVGAATVWRASASLVPCRSSGIVLGCALVAAGLVHGAGREIPEARAATGPWVGLGGRLGVRVPVGSALALEARADVVVPVVRTRLLVGQAAVWTTPAVSGALGLAVIRTFR